MGSINKVFIALVMVSALLAENTVYSHEGFVQDIGMLWNMVTNHGEFGDDRYYNPLPSCTWPGGSGNSYLYAGCIWLSGGINVYGNLNYSVLNERDGEYTPMDSIHVMNPGLRADQETYTKYWDVVQPWSSTGDDPLGLTIEERTFAWKNALADDFIITEYTIKNVGIDTNDDAIPDKQRDIHNFTFTVRMDADVSQKTTWDAEGEQVNGDDHACSNAGKTFTVTDAVDTAINGTYSGWDFVKLDPYMRRQLEVSPFLLDSLNAFPLDSMMSFMWDGDNPDYDADDWGLDTNLLSPGYDLDHRDDDSGNPDVDGKLNSPGYIGWRMLKSEPYLAPKSYITCTIHDSPRTDASRWANYINSGLFCSFNESVDLDSRQWRNGQLTPDDYSTLTSYGSLDTLKSGDSVVVTIAYGIGVNKEKGGIYSLLELNRNLKMAQYIVDHDYQVDFSTLTVPVEIPISIHDELYESDLVFGWSDNATDGYDMDLDRHAEPQPPVGNFDARFITDEEDYLRDLRYPPTGESMVWNMRYSPSTGNAPVNIEWDPLDLPEEGSCFLLDTTGHVLADMRVANRYRDESGDEKYLKIVYDPNQVAVSDNNSPDQFILKQNYPNPFNPSTTIAFQLPADATVELTVFDLNGRKVSALIHERLSAGYHDVTWNAGNHSSGVYIYLLKAGDHFETGKMVLTK